MPKIIFVVGSPRSGTTYLSRTLGLAENAAYLGESNLFCLSANRIDTAFYAQHMHPGELFPYNRLLIQLLNGSDRLRKKDRVRDAVEHLLLMSKVEEYDLKPSDTLYKVQNITLDPEELLELDDLTQKFRQLLCKEGLAAYARAYFDEFALRKNCDVIVEKTPFHLRYLPVLRAVFPESKMVLICRNKKECLSSYLRTFGKGYGINRFLPSALARKKIWQELLADVEREEWAMKQPEVTRMEFSDFVAHPAEMIESIADKLGLHFEPNTASLNFPAYDRVQK